jgi:hypothetical protein
MTQSVGKASLGYAHDGLPILAANVGANRRQYILASVVTTALFIVLAATAPFATVQLTRSDAFVPTLQTALCIANLVTAALLLSQYSIQPQHALLALAAGYMFAGLFSFIQTLVFPGVYTPTGLFGAGPNSAGGFSISGMLVSRSLSSHMCC